MRRQAKSGTSFGYTPRTWGRLVVLLVMVALILFLATRVRQPGTWAWLAAAQQAPEEIAAPASQPGRERQSIDPDRDKLRGAADREPFLLENPQALLRGEEWQRQLKDADARYELLLYAKESRPGSLFADGRTDVRFADLLARPQDYRGEVLRLRGDLLWIRTMELKRPGVGMQRCYQGLLTVQHPERAYWLLFTELPAGLADQGNALYLPNVEFAGYFHKIVAVEPAAGKTEPRLLPVLVGQTLRLPATPPPGEDLLLLVGIFLAAATPVALIGLGAWWLYRRGDRSLRAKMAEVRQRAQARDEAAVAQLEPGSTTEVNGAVQHQLGE